MPPEALIELLLADVGDLAGIAVELQLEIHLIADFQDVDHGRSDAAHDLQAEAGPEEYGQEFGVQKASPRRRSLRDGDVLIVWKLDRLGRTLTHLVSTVQNLSDRGIGLRVLTGKGAQIDATTPSGRMVFGIFATLAEFERDMIRERTMAGLAAARARGRKGGRKFALSKAQVRLAQAAMAQRDTSVSDLCKELGIERVTLYRYVGPNGELRDYGQRVLAAKTR